MSGPESATSNTTQRAGLLGTKIPSVLAFSIGMLLFLLPFTEMKCNGEAVATKSGLDISLNNGWRVATNDRDVSDEIKGRDSNSEKEGNSRLFALVALSLAVIGLAFSFTEAKTASTAGLVTGLLAATSLICLMIDLKKWFNNNLDNEVFNKVKDSLNDLGLGTIKNSSGALQLGFTPWLYVSIVAFLAAAIFSLKRLQSSL